MISSTQHLPSLPHSHLLSLRQKTASVSKEEQTQPLLLQPHYDRFLSCSVFLKRDISAVSPSAIGVMLLDSLSKLLEKLCRTRFGYLLLCYLWMPPMESIETPYGSSCLLGASLACEKWMWCLHGQG